MRPGAHSRESALEMRARARESAVEVRARAGSLLVVAGANTLARFGRFRSSLVVAGANTLADSAGSGARSSWPGANTLARFGRFGSLFCRWSPLVLSVAALERPRGEPVNGKAQPSVESRSRDAYPGDLGSANQREKRRFALLGFRPRISGALTSAKSVVSRSRDLPSVHRWSAKRHLRLGRATASEPKDQRAERQASRRRH